MAENSNLNARQQQINRTARRLMAAGVLMFGFAFALVPIYNMLCDALGLNGKTSGAYQYDQARAVVDKTRLIKVEFLTNNNAYMPWDFKANKSSVRVHPGMLTTATFHARNTTDAIMVGQAVPNVAPSQAAQYFHKTECFCFEQQKLAPGESIEMPLRFIVDVDLPQDVKTISLGYTMFDATDHVSISAR